MYQLYQMSNSFGTRPSDMVAIPLDEDWLRFQFDRAVTTIGYMVDSALQKNSKKKSPSKPELIIRKVLKIKRKDHEYTPLAANVTKTVKISPDQDVWEALKEN